MKSQKFPNYLFPLIFSLSVLSAGTDGTVRGKISDIDQRPLPGAMIYIPELETGAIADPNGNYIILNIPVGTYDIHVSMMGYRKVVTKEVKVMMDQTVWLNFSLVVAMVEGEEIEVIGERPLVEKATTSKKITMSQEAVEALPIRDLTELYSLQSGVVEVSGMQQGSIEDHEERGLQEIHVRGGRSGEIAYMIDGMYIRNPIYGGIGNGTRLNLFSTAEFDWQPGGFNAEYGDAMSAVSNLHTATGGSEFKYKFKYQTSMVGAVIGNEYDDLRGVNDYNIGFGGRLPWLLSKFYYWFSGQYTNMDNYRVYKFDDNIYIEDPTDPTNSVNRENLVQPWDTQKGFRGFGNDLTWDVFGKLTYKHSSRMWVNLSIWELAAHRKSFSHPYLYWDKGKNELFRDTHRYAADFTQALSSRTFITVRASRFVQDELNGVRWDDSDKDGYPDWFEWRHPSGNNSSLNNPISDPYNPLVVPYTLIGDTVKYTQKDNLSGWYHGATPGLYSWESAEDFVDKNGNAIYDQGIDGFSSEFDQNDNGEWDGPELVKECYYRDGSYWLEPEMYVDYEDFVDYRNLWHAYDQDPWRQANISLNDDRVYYYPGVNPENGTLFNEDAPNYYMPTFDGSWDEGMRFGGHDRFYSTSKAVTDEIRIDLTSQLTDKWKVRTGLDYKTHKLNFYEVKEPWNPEAIDQVFSEFWYDYGLDGIKSLDPDSMDLGENNGIWDDGERFRDSNNNGEWDDFREPAEFSAYIQNTFEVPWMVINFGVRLDAVNYNTEVWGDTLGDYSPGIPWYFKDCGTDGLCEGDDYWPGPDVGERNESWDSGELSSTDPLPEFGNELMPIFKQSSWTYKISPRLGFSHVITDKSTFTFNYGLYYQTPIYSNVFLQTNQIYEPQELFEEGAGLLGNGTLSAQRTQSYSSGFNVQVGRNWAYTIMVWVKDVDQWLTYKPQRTGIYSYKVWSNGDYGSAKGLDLTLEYRSRFVNSLVQYTYSVAKGNSEYDWMSAGTPADENRPSQEFLMPYDRPNDLTISFYTPFPWGFTIGLTGFYQSGYPYTPLIKTGENEYREDETQKYTKRAPAYRMINLSLSKAVKLKDFKVSCGLSVYNVFDMKNPQVVYALTGKADDPGTYLTDQIGLAGHYNNSDHNKSGSYYDAPWRYTSPREINFFIRVDFR